MVAQPPSREPGHTTGARPVESSAVSDATRSFDREWSELSYPYNRAIAEFLDERERGETILEWADWQRAHSLAAQLAEWEELQRARRREEWARLEEAQQEAFRDSLPPNWKSPDIEFPDLEVLERLQLEEGLPLAWVPPNEVLAQLLSCKTAAARRKVIARGSAHIVAACRRELRRLRSAETREWRSSAREAADAMDASHWRAGQALAAIALDTATDRFVRSSYAHATRHGTRGRPGSPPGTSDQSLPTWFDVDYPRGLLVLHSLYGAFSTYDLKNNDPVPVNFTRHGTVHSLNRRQYSKANALIALMHLVGLLCLIEDE